MNKNIPTKVLDIYKEIQKNNIDIYFVGGCVRNILMNIAVKDWDLTSNATPQEILKIFPDGFYNNDFGTVGVPIDDNSIIEITTFRTEQGFSNKRHPDKVLWGKTIQEDLSRRDFTMNAIALKFVNDHEELVDPYGGKIDIENRIIRCVGNPSERFKEDALRLLRAIRFATVLSFNIDEKTGKEIVSDAPLIQQISFERIRDELLKILDSENPYKGILLLKDSGLLKYIIPELLEGINVSQVRPGRHHTTDVFTHNLLALKFCPSKDPIVRFATLIHDAGKPRVKGEDEHGLVTFYNHEVAGAKLAYEICERLKFSKKDRERVVSMIRWHMFTVDENITDAAIRRFIRRIGVKNVKDLIDLRIGDRLGSGTETAESWRLKKFKERIEKELAPAAFSINDLAIDGNDIMKILNIKPGPEIGKILQEIFDEIDQDQSKNTKEYLENRVKEIHK